MTHHVTQDPNWVPPYSDEDFFDQLEKGHQIELQIARRIRDMGFDCPDPVLEKRGSVAEIHRFTENQTDLKVNGTVNIEIKSRNLKFTGPHDFPFDDIIVDGKHTFDTKKNRPDLYLMYSIPTGTILVIDPRFKDQWTVKQSFNNRRQSGRVSYFAPKEVLKPEAYLEGYLSALAI